MVTGQQSGLLHSIPDVSLPQFQALAMINVGTASLEIDVARDKIVMGLGELTGNIWSLKR